MSVRAPDAKKAPEATTPVVPAPKAGILQKMHDYNQISVLNVPYDRLNQLSGFFGGKAAGAHLVKKGACKVAALVTDLFKVVLGGIFMLLGDVASGLKNGAVGLRSHVFTAKVAAPKEDLKQDPAPEAPRAVTPKKGRFSLRRASVTAEQQPVVESGK
ncbi:MAG: hypothetical protein WC371_03455 [Parachlamydiales bacterium]|jgi:hypothetical protein